MSEETEQSHEQAPDDQWENRETIDSMAETETLETLYGPDESDETATDETERTISDTEQTAARHEAAPETGHESDDTEQAPEQAYTPQEWRVYGQVAQEIQQLQADEKRLLDTQQAIANCGGDIVKACSGDRDKAAAVRTDMKALAENIAVRKRGASRVIQHVQAKQQLNHVKQGRAAMAKKEPALNESSNRQALAGWLLDQGFSAPDISAISPKQAAAAWKLYSKDTAAPPRKLMVPKAARKPRKKANNDVLQGSLNLSTEELFASVGEPKPQTVLYGLPSRKQNTQPQKSNEAIDILYGTS